MQIYQSFKFVIFFALFFSAALPSYAQSEAAVSPVNGEVGTSSANIFSFSKKSYEELYSENSYYEEYNLVTDTRVRHYQPFHEGAVTGLAAYVGANLQYQSAGAKQKYFDNAITPYIGMQGDLFKKIFLQVQAGVRTVINDNNESNETQWDPRVVLSAGDFWHWATTAVFTEAYGEVAYVPRLDSTPVSTGWVKQGYRFKPLASLNVDPYAEFYSRESRSPDLGPSMTEGRFGLRTQWVPGAWNVSALVYHPVNRKEAHGDVEGLLVVGGIF